MFLMTFNIFKYIYMGKSQMGHICPMLANQYPKIFSIKCLYFIVYISLGTRYSDIGLRSVK